MVEDVECERDIAETELVLFKLAEQDALIKKRVVLAIMEKVVILWLELKREATPYGNWEFTEDDRKTLHTSPTKISILLDTISQRALPVH